MSIAFRGGLRILLRPSRFHGAVSGPPSSLWTCPLCWRPAFAIRPFSTETTGKTAEEKAQAAETEKNAQAAGTEEQANKQRPEEPEKDLDTLKSELAAAVADSKKMRNELAYALADIDNVRKIAKKDVAAAREYALKEFGKDLLDVSDTLDRALTVFPPEAKTEGHPSNSVYVGIEMTSGTLRKVMERHGITRMEITPKETEFDPNFHNALSQLPVKALPGGIILNVVKPGYMLKNRVLRPADVIVTSEPETEEVPPDPKE